MLSVGKLTHLAHLQSAPSPEPDKVLECGCLQFKPEEPSQIMM